MAHEKSFLCLRARWLLKMSASQQSFASIQHSAILLTLHVCVRHVPGASETALRRCQLEGYCCHFMVLPSGWLPRGSQWNLQVFEFMFSLPWSGQGGLRHLREASDPLPPAHLRVVTRALPGPCRCFFPNYVTSGSA